MNYDTMQHIRSNLFVKAARGKHKKWSLYTDDNVNRQILQHTFSPIEGDNMGDH